MKPRSANVIRAVLRAYAVLLFSARVLCAAAPLQRSPDLGSVHRGTVEIDRAILALSHTSSQRRHFAAQPRAAFAELPELSEAAVRPYGSLSG